MISPKSYVNQVVNKFNSIVGHLGTLVEHLRQPVEIPNNWF